jgi:predicted transcriptional regulator
VVDKLTQTEYEFFETLLPYFAEHPAIDAVTAKDISKKSPTSVRRYFNKLVKLGFIETIGANKNRVYRPLPGFSSNLSTTRTVDKPVDKLTQTNE